MMGKSDYYKIQVIQEEIKQRKERISVLLKFRSALHSGVMPEIMRIEKLYKELEKL